MKKARVVVATMLAGWVLCGNVACSGEVPGLTSGGAAIEIKQAFVNCTNPLDMVIFTEDKAVLWLIATESSFPIEKFGEHAFIGATGPVEWNILGGGEGGKFVNFLGIAKSKPEESWTSSFMAGPLICPPFPGTYFISVLQASVVIRGVAATTTDAIGDLVVVEAFGTGGPSGDFLIDVWEIAGTGGKIGRQDCPLKWELGPKNVPAVAVGADLTGNEVTLKVKHEKAPGAVAEDSEKTKVFNPFRIAMRGGP